MIRAVFVSLLVWLSAVMLFHAQAVFGRPVVTGLIVWLISFLVAAVAPLLSLLFTSFCLLSLPLLGSGMLCLWVLGASLGVTLKPGNSLILESKNQQTICYGLCAVLVLFLSAVLGPFVKVSIVSFDTALMRGLFSFSGTADTLKYVLETRPLWWTSSRQVVQVSAALLFVAAYLPVIKSHRAKALQAGLWGLVIGAFFASVVLLGQVLELHPYFSITRNDFFVFVGRYSASLSDPNAFGVICMLVCPLLLANKAILYRAAGSALLIAGLWSGSRTMLVGCILYLVMLLFKKSKALALGFIACLAIGVLLLSSEVMRPKFVESLKSPSVSRLADVLDTHGPDSALHSRTLFARIGLEIWKANPIVGSGLGCFYQLQAVTANELGLNLGTWRDNANNFYLHVLAEGGILSLTAILTASFLGLLLIRSRPTETIGASARLVIYLMLVMLLTGPHLFFDEVLFGLCLVCLIALSTCAVDNRGKWFSSRWIFRLAVVFLLIQIALVSAISSQAKERGLYALELSPEGTFRWTGGWGSFVAPQELMRVKALNPDLEVQPVELYLEQGGQVQRVAIKHREWVELVLREPGEKVDFSVSRVWVPSQFGQGADYRALGVIFEWPNFETNVCAND